MGYMKHFKCPTCQSTEFVTRQRKREVSIIFLCNKCEKYFSINTHWINRKEILSDHLDGLSFRKLVVKYNISKSQAWDICHEELSKLPTTISLPINIVKDSPKYFCLMENISISLLKNMIGQSSGESITFVMIFLFSPLL